MVTGSLRVRARREKTLVAGQSHEAVRQASSQGGCGIHKNIGWHTFRHSFGTLLEANGEDVKTVQELLRQ